jgi:hypothetical protein
MFMEKTETPLNNIWPDDFHNVSLSVLEDQIVGHLNINWHESRTHRSINLPSLEEQQLHVETKFDNQDTRTVKSVINVLFQIETHLNNQKLFQHMGVKFYPVGSVLEGTKICPLDEMDFMVSVSKLNDVLTIDDAKTLRINEDMFALLVVLGLDRVFVYLDDILVA